MLPHRESPYDAVFGDELGALHPRLRDYFGAIPAGHYGWGVGCFERVGTPRRWLWPALWLLQRQGVLFPGWHRDVNFTVRNTPGVTPEGLPTVRSARRFEFSGGARVMVDSIEAVGSEGPRLVDYLGAGRLVEATLAAAAIDGVLHMWSTDVVLVLARFRLPIPAVIAPRVTLSESFDDQSNRQNVTVSLDAPLLGRLYEYSGAFRYVILPENGGS